MSGIELDMRTLEILQKLQVPSCVPIEITISDTVSISYASERLIPFPDYFATRATEGDVFRALRDLCEYALTNEGVLRGTGYRSFLPSTIYYEQGMPRFLLLPIKACRVADGFETAWRLILEAVAGQSAVCAEATRRIERVVMTPELAIHRLDEEIARNNAPITFPPAEADAAPPIQYGETGLLGLTYNDAPPQSAQTQPKPNVVFVVRKNTNERMRFAQEQMTIGRGTCDFVVRNNSAISRKHAIVLQSTNGFLLQDCGATNGVKLRGMRLSPNSVERIEIGEEFMLANELFYLQQA